MKNALKIRHEDRTKNVRSIHRGGEAHWVGDGFPVHTVFSYQDLGADLTPLPASRSRRPRDFGPTDEERGVGWHPHRGFERPHDRLPGAKSITRTPAATGAASARATCSG